MSQRADGLTFEDVVLLQNLAGIGVCTECGGLLQCRDLSPNDRRDFFTKRNQIRDLAERIDALLTSDLAANRVNTGH